jgi:hypothetical protein
MIQDSVSITGTADDSGNLSTILANNIVGTYPKLVDVKNSNFLPLAGSPVIGRE